MRFGPYLLYFLYPGISGFCMDWRRESLWYGVLYSVGRGQEMIEGGVGGNMMGREGKYGT